MALTGSARAVAEVRDGRTVLTTLRSQLPLRLRETCDGLTVVASAFGPLGGDRTRLELVAGEGARLLVRTAAAQVAQPGVHDAVSHAEVRIDAAAGAHVRWLPEPLVVTEGAEHRSALEVDVDPSATLVVAETVVLGRTPGRPGRLRSSWRARCGGRPLLACDLDVGAGAPTGSGGPAVTGGARVLLTALVTGPNPLPSPGPTADGAGEVLPLAGPGVLLTWLGDDPVAAARALTALLATVGAVPNTPVSADVPMSCSLSDRARTFRLSPGPGRPPLPADRQGER